MAACLILTVNTGSSSVKVEAFDQTRNLTSVFKASAKNIGGERASLSIQFDELGQADQQPTSFTDHKQAIKAILAAFERRFDRKQLSCIAHRVVHGGSTFSKACKLDESNLTALRELAVLAPDHMPQALAAIDFFRDSFEALPQIAAFDTTFHADMPARASHYALPPEFAARGIKRYGFHGLSYTYVVQALAKLEPAFDGSRLIVAHLGSGASVAAISCGRSMDTSMGFSPDSGLAMASRAGDIDAAAVLHLLQHEHLSIEEIETLLNKNAGLKGMAGHGGDMQQLLERRSSERAAQQAIDMFCYRIQRYIGAYAAVLGGCQMLVFTGGIGENAAEIREQICQNMQFMGIEIDPAANQAHQAVISTPSSRVKIRIIATDEDLVIAQQAATLLAVG